MKFSKLSLIVIMLIAFSSCSTDRTPSPRCQSHESPYKKNEVYGEKMPDFNQIKRETNSMKSPYGSRPGDGRTCN